MRLPNVTVEPLIIPRRWLPGPAAQTSQGGTGWLEFFVVFTFTTTKKPDEPLVLWPAMQNDWPGLIRAALRDRRLRLELRAYRDSKVQPAMSLPVSLHLPPEL